MQSQNSSAFESQAKNLELLKEYKDLLDSGIITQDEFDAKKKELLSSSSYEAPVQEAAPQPNPENSDEASLDPEQPLENRGMKWHKFLVNIGLPAQIVCLITIGVLLAAAPFIAEPILSPFLSEVLDKTVNVSIDSDLATIGFVFYGIMIVSASLFAISARKKLKNLENAGSNMLMASSYGCILMANIPLIGIFYCDLFQNIFDASEDTIWSISLCMSVLLYIAVYIYLFGNKSYYKKRKHMLHN